MICFKIWISFPHQMEFLRRYMTHLNARLFRSKLDCRLSLVKSCPWRTLQRHCWEKISRRADIIILVKMPMFPYNCFYNTDSCLRKHWENLISCVLSTAHHPFVPKPANAHHFWAAKRGDTRQSNCHDHWSWKGENNKRWQSAAVMNLPGCVHLISVSKLAQVKNAFSFGQWAHQCKQHNRYGGSMVEINSSQAKMHTIPLKLGPITRVTLHKNTLMIMTNNML